VSCVISAVDKRDTAIIAAFDTYTSAARSALTVRKDALKVAWAIADTSQRKTAIRAAHKTYRSSVMTARNNFKNAKKTAWKQFKSDAKLCGTSVPSEEFEGQSTDNLL
jgi:hypothetical protein